MTSYQLQQNEMTEGKCYFILEIGKSQLLRQEILHHLQKHRPGWKEVHNVDACDVILVLCPIVSRAGTDTDAALNKLNTHSASKPAIFMVFHHSFDPEKFIPDSCRVINRRNTLTVDCLFNEDEGLLKCSKNDKALTKIVHHLKPQKRTKYSAFTIILALVFSSYVGYKLIQYMWNF